MTCESNLTLCLDILDVLETLVIIAQQFGGHKLGTLIFVHRDSTSTKEDVSKVLFSKAEGDSGPVLRAREAIAAAFTKLLVFCLPTPASVPEMSLSTFNISQCSSEFVTGIREIKTAIVQECVIPRLVQNIPLTGAGVVEITRRTIASINANEVNVFPDGSAQILVQKIVDQIISNANGQFSEFIRSKSAQLCDPDKLATSVRTEKTVIIGSTNEILRNYPDDIVLPRKQLFLVTMDAFTTSAVEDMQSRITAILNRANEAVLGSGVNWTLDITSKIETFTRSSLDVASRDFLRQCMASFNTYCATNNVDPSWPSVANAASSVQMHVTQTIIQKVSLDYERAHHTVAWVSSQASAWLNSFLSRDIMAEFVGFKLDNNDLINDTKHGVLRSVDISKVLWEFPIPPTESEDTLFLKLKRDLLALKEEGDQSNSTMSDKRKHLVAKGLAALDDMGFLQTSQNVGTGDITVRTLIVRVYNAIRMNVEKKEVLIALCDELFHSRPDGFDNLFGSSVTSIGYHGCPGGIASRLFNSLRGFCSIPSMPLDPSLREGFSWAFPHRVLNKSTLSEALKEADDVLDEYGIIMFTERENWLKGVREKFADATPVSEA